MNVVRNETRKIEAALTKTMHDVLLCKVMYVLFSCAEEDCGEGGDERCGEA